MYKNLNARVLGVSGHQSELIELALTYGFKGIDVDMLDLAKRVEAQGREYGCRFIDSAQLTAQLKIGGFELPVRWQGNESHFKADLEQLKSVCELAQSLGAQRATTDVAAAGDDMPYHEFFEFHTKRLRTIADVLAQYEIRLGLSFRASASHRDGHEYQFIYQAEPLLTLIKTIGHPNVGLTLDTWNWQVGGGGMDQLGELTADQFVIVRLADVPDDADMTAVEENLRLLPGQSETSIAESVVIMLAEIGYDGPVSAIANPGRIGGRTRDQKVQKTQAALEELWKAAGLSKAPKPAPVPAEAEAAT